MTDYPGPGPAQPPGQPPYGPPPGPPPGGFPPGPAGRGYGPYGPPPGRKSKVPWVIGGAAIAVVAAIAIVLVLVMGGSDGKSGPAAAVDKILKADVHDDLAGEKAVACGAVLDSVNSPDAGEHAGLKSYQVGKVTQHGDSAQVAAKMTFDGTGGAGHPTAGTYPVMFTTEKQKDGSWKVCDLQQLGGDGAPSTAGTIPQ